MNKAQIHPQLLKLQLILYGNILFSTNRTTCSGASSVCVGESFLLDSDDLERPRYPQSVSLRQDQDRVALTSIEFLFTYQPFPFRISTATERECGGDKRWTISCSGRFEAGYLSSPLETLPPVLVWLTLRSPIPPAKRTKP